MLLSLKRGFESNQITFRDTKVFCRDDIRFVRFGPVFLRLPGLEHDRHLTSKLLAPDGLVLWLRHMDPRGASAGYISPCLQVVTERTLFGVYKSVLGRSGDLRFGENGGHEDASVGVCVASVIDVGVATGRLGEDVGAVAAGLWYQLAMRS